MKIQGILPILCVDIIINTEKGILLGRRTNEPVRGFLWFPGGRVFFGEAPERAAVRKAMEETGLKVRILGFAGAYSTVFKKGEKRHTVNMLYIAKKTGGKLRADKQHSEFVFIKKIEDNLHPYVKRTLRDCDAFGRSPKFLPIKEKRSFIIN